jgi:hypothetical protein
MLRIMLAAQRYPLIERRCGGFLDAFHVLNERLRERIYNLGDQRFPFHETTLAIRVDGFSTGINDDDCAAMVAKIARWFSE